MASTLEALKMKNEALRESRRAANVIYCSKKDRTEVQCGCGSIYKKYIKWQHDITNKHIAWLESQQPVVVAPEPVPEPVIKVKMNRKIKNVMVVPVEVPVVEAVPEPVVDHLKNAEDNVIKMSLLMNVAENKLNRLYELVSDCSNVDSLTITQMISICALVVRMKNDTL